MKKLIILVVLILVLGTSAVYAMDIESIDRAKMAQNAVPAGACPSNYAFASGGGAWVAYLDINKDWSFSGGFHDLDMGGGGPGYEHGTELICQYSGRFGEPEQIDEFSYRIPLISLDTEHEEGYEFIEDSVLHIAVGPVGMENTDEFILYLPGTPLSYLSEYVRSWIRVDPYSGALSGDMYLFYNPGEGITFISRASEDTEWLSLPVDPDEAIAQIEAETDNALDTGLTEEIEKLQPCLYAVAYEMEYGEREFIPSKDSGRFWPILFTFNELNTMPTEETVREVDGRPRIFISTDNLKDAAYCIFPDFTGEFPEVDNNLVIYNDASQEYGFGFGNFGEDWFDIAGVSEIDDRTIVVTVDLYYIGANNERHSQYYDVYLNKNKELNYGYQIQRVEMQ